MLLWVPCLLGAADLELSAEVDRTTIAFGERLTLTVTATGPDAGGLPQPRLPVMTDFRPVSVTCSRFTSDSTSDNGDTLRTAGFVYILMPRRTGFLTVGSFKLVCGGKTYETQPIGIRVVPAGESVPPLLPWADADGVELVCTADRTSAFIGEQVQVAYRMFKRTRIGGMVMKDVPQFEGFWAAEVHDTGNLEWEPTTRGGQPCSVAIVRRATLFPLRPGRVEVGRMTLAGVVAVAGGLFNGMQAPFTVSSVPLSVMVRPLPDSGRPADFAGGVGKFDLSARLSANRTRNGEPLTLEVTVSGTGNLGMVGEPQVRVAEGVKLLAPEPEQQFSFKNGRVQGVRTFSYPMIPRADGLNIVPAASMSFFDPAGDTYYTLKTGSEAFVATGVSGSGNRNGHGSLTGFPGADVLHIKTHYSRVHPAVANPYWSGLFYPLGVLVLFTGALVGRRRRRLESDRGYALRSRAGRLLRKRLRESARLLAADDMDGFYAALSHAVVGYAGDRFNVESTGMTDPELRAALCRRGLDPAVVNRVLDFSSRCAVARFSHGTSVLSPREALDLARSITSAL